MRLLVPEVDVQKGRCVPGSERVDMKYHCEVLTSISTSGVRTI